MLLTRCSDTDFFFFIRWPSHAVPGAVTSLFTHYSLSEKGCSIWGTPSTHKPFKQILLVGRNSFLIRDTQPMPNCSLPEDLQHFIRSHIIRGTYLYIQSLFLHLYRHTGLWQTILCWPLRVLVLQLSAPHPKEPFGITLISSPWRQHVQGKKEQKTTS